MVIKSHEGQRVLRVAFAPILLLGLEDPTPDLFDQINKNLEREPTSRVEFMPAGSCLWKVQHSSPPEWKLKCRHVLESPGDVLDCVFRGVVTKIRPP